MGCGCHGWGHWGTSAFQFWVNEWVIDWVIDWVFDWVFDWVDERLAEITTTWESNAPTLLGTH